MITHNEIVTVVGAGCVSVVWFLGWWSRGPRAKSLDDAYDLGREDAAREIDEIVRRGRVLRPSLDGEPGWCDAGSQCDQDGANAPVGFDEPQSSFKNVPRPGERPSGSEVAGPGRTIYPELAALGAPVDAEPSEPVPVRLDETSEQWAARMDMEAAIWCAENGIERETAGSRL